MGLVLKKSGVKPKLCLSTTYCLFSDKHHYLMSHNLAKGRAWPWQSAKELEAKAVKP